MQHRLHVRAQPPCVDEARGAAEKALKLEPTSWKANHQLGIIFEAAKLKEKACSFYRRAIELAPKEWQPRNNLAVLLMEAKTPAASKEALVHLEEAAKLQGASATVHYNLALARMQNNLKARAKEAASLASTLGVTGNPIAQMASELTAALA